ncbi:heavy-metal-associated domain-containing protein [Oceanirhabdus sp. W0125-5]|uniref:heavy-metal-associated domain-containing protein n=1 Tax=Oceanirhabdus sp. W0125-5 TaxID=2999116 RepID=UPI0022F32805|nr:heavy metal-associated domain-containing protein [Oceanirhabdus sp. W0125-5]WBW97492.1 heavy metal-associated domain-containing protein [Oceanirhabdus sp. W0125-5]
MKEVISICGMKSSKDVNKVKQAISFNDGVLACKIERKEGKAEIVFNQYTNIDEIIASIEEMGFTVI